MRLRPRGDGEPIKFLRTLAIGERVGKAGPDLLRSPMKRCSHARFPRCEDDGALRDALKSRAVETTHSEALELIARAFGYENWNILSAKIDAAEPRAGGERALSPTGAHDSVPPKTLYCSFCGKSQHDVVKLIAGPSVYICDECVEICVDCIRDESPIWKVLNLLTAGKDNEDAAYVLASEHVRAKSTEEVASYVESSRRLVPNITGLSWTAPAESSRCGMAKGRHRTMSWRRLASHI